MKITTKPFVFSYLAISIILCFISCKQTDQQFKWQKSIADSVINFYKKKPRSYDFVFSYYSANSDSSISTGSSSFYIQNAINYRIKVDSIIHPHDKLYMGADVCRNEKLFGCNYLEDTTYEDLGQNPSQLLNLVGVHQPDYIFRADTFRKRFSDNKKYLISFNDNPGKDFYTICSLDTNSYGDDMLVSKGWFINYKVSKKDYRVLGYSYNWEYVVDGAKYRDSAKVFFNYHNLSEQSIINYIQSFSSFKKQKMAGDTSVLSQDTISIFPSFTLPDEHMKNYASSKCTSRFTLVEFWYRACLPCMKNIKRLNDIRNTIDQSVLEIVAINDVDKLNDDTKSFIRRFKPNYIMLFNGQEIREKLKIMAHPATYIYDNKTQKVIYIKSGTCDTYSEEIINFIKKSVK
jgi:hypothetical protein